ncbi:hypothetical protein B0H16DRAFT_1229668, partial [Mycena metata]
YGTPKGGGPFWTSLVDALVQFEWSHYHSEERGRLSAGAHRPDEFPQWMKEHRVYDDYTISAGFGAGLLAWWQELGPKTRWAGVEAGAPLPDDFRSQEAWPVWGRLDVSGRSRLLLFVLGLAWWGQTIWNE